MLSSIARLTFISLFLFTQSLYSQDFNAAFEKEFLKSLPKSIGKGISEDETMDPENEKDYNQLPDTRINKLQESLERIESDLKIAESLIAQELGKEIDDKKLPRFGDNFFSTFQSTFSAVSEPNIDSSYILGFNDFLKIQIVSQVDNIHKLRVERDGSINIPEIGSITVSGLSFDEAKDTIIRRVQEMKIGASVYVSMGQLKNINVLVLGASQFPGVYTLPGSTNYISALRAAGGISENGSYRSIIHKRNNVVINELDLYDLLIYGNFDTSARLQNGDVLIVSPKLNQVSISGAVGFPAIYETKDNESIEYLISISGKLNQDLNGNISLERNGVTETVNDLNILLLNGDSIQIEAFTPKPRKIKYVNIDGAVRNPGRYSLSSNETLSSLIIRAGGYKDNAYPFGGILNRESVARTQKLFFDISYRDLIKYLASSGQANLIATSPQLSLILRELKDVKPSGRLTAEFNLDKIARDSSLDTLIMDNDDIFIPYFKNEVVVVGEVLVPQGITYDGDIVPNKYISLAGGLTRYADLDRAIIISPNGDASLLKNKFNNIFSGGIEEVLPGSIIYIPREIGRIEGISYAATVAPIISSIALSLASLNSIN